MGNSDPGQSLTPRSVITAARSEDVRSVGRPELDWCLGTAHAFRHG